MVRSGLAPQSFCTALYVLKLGVGLCFLHRCTYPNLRELLCRSFGLDAIALGIDRQFATRSG
jgi:hypothetical protein|eukprot:COSAG02_NODE_4384_length_5422_cov_23.616757_5_plen_62_part_00